MPTCRCVVGSSTGNILIGGYLSGKLMMAAGRQALNAQGFVEGRNVAIEYR
jgi:hypothetical protein